MGKFRRGVSGNPKGRPVGSRSASAALLDQIGSEAAISVLHAMIRKARKGDVAAGSLILSRCWQPRHGRTIRFQLPELRSAGDVVNAIAAVGRQVADGMLSPDEGAAICGMIETHRKAIETNDLAARIAALEQQRHD